MMNDDCESDLKMENVIFVYPRPPISWGRYIRQEIDKYLDLLVARSLGSLHPPNKCATTVMCLWILTYTVYSVFMFLACIIVYFACAF